jgi:hypothetical protein
MGTPSIAQSRYSAECVFYDMDLVASDNIVRIAGGPADPTALPGEVISPALFRFERQSEALVHLAGRFLTEGFTSSSSGTPTITSDTAKAFRALLSHLPAGSSLPRIAPDGEGGLLLHWDNASQEVLAVLDNWTLHIVEAPTTLHARYHDPIAVEEGAPPKDLLKAISG